MDVRVAGVRVGRGGRVVLAIDELDFPSGSTTAVFGPNGAGKTTLLRVLAGLERPSSGTVRLGEALVQPSAAARRAVAFAFQQAVFVSGSVRANLALGLRLRGVPADEAAARIAAVARECGIDPLLARSAHGLSTGEAQRVNIARALCLQAPLTLLDEPLANVDGPARARLLDELPRLVSRLARTTILVSHAREEALRLADRLVVIVDGGVRASGVKRDVFGRPPDADVARLLGYTILPRAGGGVIAVPPGSLRRGAGAVQFTLEVRDVVDLGSHEEVVGRIGGARVRLPLDGGERPRPGERIAVAAPHGVEFAEARDASLGAEEPPAT
jgi:ABC-type sugar transport system ATPase subunit